jgi:hypothetical protein
MNGVGMIIFRYLLSTDDDPLLQSLSEDLSNMMIVMISLSMLLSATVSMGLGISIVSFVNNTKTAEILYMVSLMIPALAISIYVISAGLSNNLWLYILPWSNTIAILLKTLYPLTYEYALITSSVALDIGLHLLYLLLFTLGTLIIAGKAFNREKII